MRHTLLIWIYFTVVLFQPGSCEEDGGVHEVEEGEEDPYSAHMPQLMNILNHYGSRMYSNVHAVLNKRSDDPSIDADSSEEADDPYGQHVHQLMAILHRVYNAKDANLHAQIHKRSDDPEDRSLNTEEYDEEDDEEDDEEEDANFFPQLVKDLHQIYNGKSDSFRTEINRRFAGHETRQ